MYIPVRQYILIDSTIHLEKPLTFHAITLYSVSILFWVLLWQRSHLGTSANFMIADGSGQRPLYCTRNRLNHAILHLHLRNVYLYCLNVLPMNVIKTSEFRRFWHNFCQTFWFICASLFWRHRSVCQSYAPLTYKLNFEREQSWL
jgi:hypothetical protein